MCVRRGRPLLARVQIAHTVASTHTHTQCNLWPLLLRLLRPAKCQRARLVSLANSSLPLASRLGALASGLELGGQAFNAPFSAQQVRQAGRQSVRGLQSAASAPSIQPARRGISFRAASPSLCLTSQRLVFPPLPSGLRVAKPASFPPPPPPPSARARLGAQEQLVELRPECAGARSKQRLAWGCLHPTLVSCERASSHTQAARHARVDSIHFRIQLARCGALDGANKLLEPGSRLERASEQARAENKRANLRA